MDDHNPIVIETADLDNVSGGRLINIRLPFGFALNNRSQRIFDSNKSFENGWSAASEFFQSIPKR